MAIILKYHHKSEKGNTARTSMPVCKEKSYIYVTSIRTFLVAFFIKAKPEYKTFQRMCGNIRRVNETSAVMYRIAGLFNITNMNFLTTYKIVEYMEII